MHIYIGLTAVHPGAGQGAARDALAQGGGPRAAEQGGLTCAPDHSAGEVEWARAPGAPILYIYIYIYIYI